MGRSEHVEQREFVRWFRQTQRRDARIFAIPNGGHRSLATAQRLKVEGVLAGVPDLYVPRWRLWVEMKRATGGRLSSPQRDMIRHLEDCGDTVIVGYGCADAIEKVEAWLESKKES